MPISEVQNIDCNVGMKQFPDKYFDLAIVDPPYGIGMAKNPLGYRKRVNQLTKHNRKTWDAKIPEKPYWDELFRVSKNQIVCGGNYFTEFLKPSMGWIVYDKLFEAHVSFSDCELIWTSFNRSLKKVRISYKTTKNNVCNNVRLAQKKAKIHPTQKPVDLYRWILKYYAQQGDKILDTHLGSGSSRIACYDSGFDFVGFELDKEYYEAQEKRFTNHKLQQTLQFI